MSEDIEITTQAALEITRLQGAGYRGVAILHDARIGLVLLLRSHDAGCACLGTAAAPIADEPHALVALPDLVVPTDATPEQAFRLAESELRRLGARLMN